MARDLLEEALEEAGISQPDTDEDDPSLDDENPLSEVLRLLGGESEPEETVPTPPDDDPGFLRNVIQSIREADPAVSLANTLGITERIKRGVEAGAAESLENQIFEAATGKPFVEPPANYEPGYIEKFFASAVSLGLSPTALLSFALGGGVGGFAVKKGLGLVFKRLVAKQVAKGVTTKAAQAVAHRTMAGAAVKMAQASGRGAGALAVFDGAKAALEGENPIKAAAKGAAVGAIALGVPAGFSNKIFKFAAEIGLFGTVSPIIHEGRAPTIGDVIDAGVTIGALKLTGKLTALARRGIQKPKGERTPEEQEAVEEEVTEDVAREIVREAQERVARVQGDVPEAEIKVPERVPEGAGERIPEAVVQDDVDLQARLEEAQAEIRSLRDAELRGPTSHGGQASLPLERTEKLLETLKEEIPPEVAPEILRAKADSEQAKAELETVKQAHSKLVAQLTERADRLEAEGNKTQSQLRRERKAGSRRQTGDPLLDLVIKSGGLNSFREPTMRGELQRLQEDPLIKQFRLVKKGEKAQGLTVAEMVEKIEESELVPEFGKGSLSEAELLNQIESRLERVRREPSPQSMSRTEVLEELGETKLRLAEEIRGAEERERAFDDLERDTAEKDSALEEAALDLAASRGELERAEAERVEVEDANRELQEIDEARLESAVSFLEGEFGREAEAGNRETALVPSRRREIAGPAETDVAHEFVSGKERGLELAGREEITEDVEDPHLVEEEPGSFALESKKVPTPRKKPQPVTPSVETADALETELGQQRIEADLGRREVPTGRGIQPGARDKGGKGTPLFEEPEVADTQEGLFGGPEVGQNVKGKDGKTFRIERVEFADGAEKFRIMVKTKKGRFGLAQEFNELGAAQEYVRGRTGKKADAPEGLIPLDKPLETGEARKGPGDQPEGFTIIESTDFRDTGFEGVPGGERVGERIGMTVDSMKRDISEIGGTTPELEGQLIGKVTSLLPVRQGIRDLSHLSPDELGNVQLAIRALRKRFRQTKGKDGPFKIDPRTRRVFMDEEAVDLQLRTLVAERTLTALRAESTPEGDIRILELGRKFGLIAEPGDVEIKDIGAFRASFDTVRGILQQFPGGGEYVDNALIAKRDATRFAIGLREKWKEITGSLSDMDKRRLIVRLNGLKTRTDVPAVEEATLRVRDEILEPAANALELPSEARLFRYFTHVFDPDVAGKLDVRGTIYTTEANAADTPLFLDKTVSIATKKVFFRHTEARAGKVPWIDLNGDRVMDTYLKGVERKVAAQAILGETQTMIDRLKEGGAERAATTAADLWARVRGFKEARDLASQRSGLLGGRGSFAQGFNNVEAAMSSFRLLMLNAKFGVVNVVGAGMNVMPFLGPKYFATGIRELATPEGREAVRNQFLTRGSEQVGEFSEVTGVFKKAVDIAAKVIAEPTEFFNRGVSYLGRRQQLLDQGVDPAKADRDAYLFSLRTNFEYNITVPRAIKRLPSIYRFKTFVANQTRFLVDMRKQNPGKLGAWLGMYMLVAGVDGLPFGRDILRASEIPDDKIAEWLNDNVAPWYEALGFDPVEFKDLPSGLPGFIPLGNGRVGINIGRSLQFIPFPRSLRTEDLISTYFGPFADLATKATRTAGKIVEGYVTAGTLNPEAARELGLLGVDAWNINALRGIMMAEAFRNNGTLMTRRGQPLRKVNMSDAILYVLGFNTSHVDHGFRTLKSVRRLKASREPSRAALRLKKGKFLASGKTEDFKAFLEKGLRQVASGERTPESLRAQMRDIRRMLSLQGALPGAEPSTVRALLGASRAEKVKVLTGPDRHMFRSLTREAQ